MKIDGKAIAREIFEELKIRVQNLKEQNIVPHLAIILVGDDPASVSYVNRKKKKGEEIGAAATMYNFPSNISTDTLLKLLKKLNEEPKIHGIIVQRPLPNHVDSELINQAVKPKKDIDAFRKDSPYLMPLASAVLKILEHIYSVISSASERSLASFEMTKGWLKSQSIVVIGKGETGGGPVIAMLKKMGIQPCVIDSKTKNQELLTQNADIIISTVGKLNIIKSTELKKGVILIGVGMYKGIDDKLHGDYEEEDIKNIASFYTPVPGGVGPINVAMLLENLLQATKEFVTVHSSTIKLSF
ncbi:MAG: hypothetical protein A3F31_01550 [Candidatus Levybacteria bacterium RIFCSPHIGHO2_12_FULL_38_12]|nr:MAG: hypothetical protein A2770_01210 [Candidatus Levybacteria bacterium RIFCSPHIGHO2_01_FULL_38_12]OGH22894.1 MAG: hypothetical protein A3F31_01550 [Candidatus Levybacteria bacterium RIFCSPHIGHO2_12_FULL_38_12]OGH34010.1 MAG: hypothetical protein A3A47_04790 [Candidatus Levybacteria bacterium RIFCSPLOWO2_01_FULL_37_20]OGH44818.1 MAG: hypothetical protein A3J14_05325 [Candidatus Levybacteria bacterium RIFCSPLOWO2_02_FULL_37_18]OGH51032.1 MAG: hypothetical protein A3G13_02085 [Candidatus Levy